MKVIASAGSFSIQSGEAVLKLRDLQVFSVAINFVGRRNSASYCTPQLTGIWFPTAPGVTSLPVAPAPTQNAEPKPANSIQAPEDFDPESPDLCALFQDLLPVNTAPVYGQEQTASVLSKPYNQITKAIGRTRTFPAVTALNYPLVLSPREWIGTVKLAFDIIGNKLIASTAVFNLAGSAATGLDYRRTLKASPAAYVLGRPENELYPLINLPGAPSELALTGFSANLLKDFSTNAANGEFIFIGQEAALTKFISVDVPQIDISIGQQTPSLIVDIVINVEALDFVVLPETPQSVGVLATTIEIPTASMILSAESPEISLDVTLESPAKDIAIQAQLPEALVDAPDPDFDSVQLLLHMDGINGSTAFLDNSNNGLGLTVNGSAVITTSEQRFGTGSLDLTGSGTNYLSYPSASGDELDVASDESVTIEFWAYITAVNTSSSPTSGNCMWESTGNLGERFSLHMLTISSTPTLVWAVNFGGDSFSHQIALTLSSWQHIAVVRNVSTWHMYIDGVQSTNSKSGYGTIMTNSNFYIIGPRQDGETKLYIDDFRHTTGVARSTTGFTPPVAAFPDS